MLSKLTFSKEKSSYSLKLNKECPFFYINRVFFNPEILPNVSFSLALIQFNYKKYKYDGGIVSEPIHLTELFIKNSKSQTEYLIDKIINNEHEFEFEKIELTIGNPSEIEFDIYYDTTPLVVSIENPIIDFEKHFADIGNARILFSAPFGQGKTTFLKYFFNESSDKYEVFYIYPIRYSISENKDIFEYIKAEIFFQLLARDIELDENKFSIKYTLPAFFKNKPFEVFASFINLLPSINQSFSGISEKLYKLGTDFATYHQEFNVTERDKLDNYLKEFYETKGSIYEDNFFTQLIRQLLEQIKLSKKQNVLIIDDIDRMDPDHIFRILNVLSAHFDTDEYQENTNKFGFDKIIIVADYLNLKKIFSHKFGLETDFCGYIDKFFSKHVYHFDNTKALTILTNQILKLQPVYSGDVDPLFRAMLTPLGQPVGQSVLSYQNRIIFFTKLILFSH